MYDNISMSALNQNRKYNIHVQELEPCMRLELADFLIQTCTVVVLLPIISIFRYKSINQSINQSISQINQSLIKCIVLIIHVHDTRKRTQHYQRLTNSKWRNKIFELFCLLVHFNSFLRDKILDQTKLKVCRKKSKVTEMIIPVF